MRGRAQKAAAPAGEHCIADIAIVFAVGGLVQCDDSGQRVLTHGDEDAQHVKIDARHAAMRGLVQQGGVIPLHSAALNDKQLRPGKDAIYGALAQVKRRSLRQTGALRQRRLKRGPCRQIFNWVPI